MTPNLRVKDGVIFRPAHFRPHMIDIHLAALKTAPPTDDGAVWVTDAWRPHDALPSLHARCLAFDYRCKNISALSEEAREDRGYAWAVRMQDELGDDYDVVAHGVLDAFHLHVEYDPR